MAHAVDALNIITHSSRFSIHLKKCLKGYVLTESSLKLDFLIYSVVFHECSIFKVKAIKNI